MTRRMLINLVDNAVKFTNAGEVTLSAATQLYDHSGICLKQRLNSTHTWPKRAQKPVTDIVTGFHVMDVC
ncbi:hypothetical protein [Paenibacillus sp. RC253]|uniref:hypothetical protein n=2 Tax=Paenibacillus TaxID=44249 RepID=UPI003837C5E1